MALGEAGERDAEQVGREAGDGDVLRIVYLPPMDVLHEAMEDLAEFFETYRQR